MIWQLIRQLRAPFALEIVLVYYVLHCQHTRHSIRLPPGPTPWPIVGNLPHLSTLPHHSLTALAKKYGPLMHLRFGFVDVVVVTSASVAAQIIKVHDVNIASRPPTSGAKHMAYNYHDLVFAPYGLRWRMFCKIKALANFRHVRQVFNLSYFSRFPMI
ncbi:putative flavonoid 3',5'-hydroxylase [Helianthus annuus]|nr:putative flavonoid 3',5'-hydroxylase [Helianthus annuus]KAJ0658131.1 putative flavonoid 3',5'-hydroxylase [Helianthus annuus]KAJ0661797.1 putative flavonoid 3',5'-hydroxylase [Helianthus annuus]KAJ0842435.1 putative flavonoid 3',5'-hydroxylase [Helianthus annuus]KAJ0856075.1 putative flavonoid 3',5'-hydroxylase [Helianthus annuus]